MVTTRRFAAFAASLALLAAPAAFDQQAVDDSGPIDLKRVDPEANLVEELVVNARLPGPAWWKVSDADSTVYVMAVPGFTPKGLDFDTSVIERRLDGANRLILAPEPKVSVVRIVSLVMTGRRYFLSETPMRQTLPPALRERLEARLKLAGEKPESMDDIKPAFAGFLVANMRQGGSVTLSGGSVAERIEKIARSGDLKKRPKVQALDGYDVIDALKSVGSLPKAQQEFCLEAGLREAEAGGPGYEAIAQRWAAGDVVKLAASDRGYQACLASAPGVAAEIRGAIDRSTRAIEAALKVPGKSVALVTFRPLLAQDGVLVRLKAKGFKVTTPGEVQP